MENLKQDLHICKYCGAETDQPDEECYAKPDTIKEAAKKYAENEIKDRGTNSDKIICGIDFIAGAKSDAARYYWF